MTEMNNEFENAIESGLDGLARPGAAPAPPAAFLKAVGRRRTQRRVRNAAVVVGVMLVSVGAFVMIRTAGRGPADLPGPIADASPVTIGSGYERLTAAAHRTTSVEGDVAPVPAVRAADWRSEAKVALLVGSS